MSTASQLANGAISIEYILTIEGIGWTDIEDTSNIDYFSGTVWATNDINGTLASDIGSAGPGVIVKKRLMMPRGISDKVDPFTLRQSIGGITFSISDDGYLLSNFTSQKDESYAAQMALTTALVWNSTTVVMDTSLSNGSYVWIGGKELVRLDNRAGAGPYTYTGCTRAVYGTIRGRQAYDCVSGFFGWPVGTKVTAYDRRYYDRRVRLWAHIPGDSVASSANNVLLLYTGRIKNIEVEGSANVWTIETAAEKINTFGRQKKSQAGWRLKSNVFIRSEQEMSQTISPPGMVVPGIDITFPDQSINPASLGFTWRSLTLEQKSPLQGLNDDWWAVGAFYLYRSVGTTPSMLQTIDAPGFITDPQSASYSPDRNVINRFMTVNGDLIRALKQEGPISLVGYATFGTPGEDHDYREIRTQVTSSFLGNNNTTLYEQGVPVTFCLDNWSENYQTSWFSSNKILFRDPISIALAFMTTMPSEYDEFEIDSVSVDGLTLTMTGSTGAANQWAGYYLFCTTETSNSFCECRKIISNNGTDIVIDYPFTGIAATDMVNIRNTYYDVLPLGWGLGIHHDYIDLDSFESMREYVKGINVPQFIMSAMQKIDLWQVIQENIFDLFNILVYTDRSTGKLTAKYVGDSLGSGVLEDYLTLTTADLVEIGTISYNMQNPIGAVTLKTRAVMTGAVSCTADLYGGSPIPAIQYNTGTWISPTLNEATTSVTIVDKELETAYNRNGIDEYEQPAMFFSEDSLREIVPFVISKLRRFSRPPPTLPIKTNFFNAAEMQSGKFVDLTVADWPANITLGVRGHSGTNAIVTSTNINFEDGTIDAELFLVESRPAGLVSPAATVSSIGSDANGAYFVVNDYDFVPYYPSPYVANSYEKDWHGFRVGDKLEFRTNQGANKSGNIYTITGFGTNFVANPWDANSSRIYHDIALGAVPAVVSNDYLCFANYAADTTTRMKKYACYSDSNAQLGPANDEAKHYV